MPSSRRSSRRPYGEDHRPLDLDRLGSMPRTERVAGGRSGGRTGDGGREFTVRQVGPSDAQYRCPGCDQIVTRVAHVVVWSADHLFGDDAAIGERRHWHTGCWRAYRAGRR